MNARKLSFVCLAVASWACGSPARRVAVNGFGGASGQAGSTASGLAGSNASDGSSFGGSSSGDADSGSSSGGAGGTAAGGMAGGTFGGQDGGNAGSLVSGSTGGEDGGSGGGSAGSSSTGADGGIVQVDGGVNGIPADYAGTPFTQNVIPGFIYVANYDKGGPGVAYCHSGNANTPAACAGGIHLTDWCCSDTNAQLTGARCDDRSQALGSCPLYRPDDDNAGLSHMNLGEVDTYATAGPTWVAGANGPTLTGPAVTIGTPVPQHADMTTEDDTYLSYTAAGEWQKYTVEVLSTGTYSIGALMGTPPNVKVTFDFGNGITSGTVALPASPLTQACKCLEAYHAWNSSPNIGTVTFPAAGTYLMTLTLNAGTYNPLYFTFTKM
jgi:hypothetical protein